ncbi:MAG: hypothetical protein QNJ55_33425 [Xenococcus sp. MO_188.B8]|nr:hypothetical protein [Xenococcus sp. MO_188.B8]
MSDQEGILSGLNLPFFFGIYSVFLNFLRHNRFSRLRQGLQHFATSRVLFPKSAPEADLKLQSPELAQILRLAA